MTNPASGRFAGTWENLTYVRKVFFFLG